MNALCGSKIEEEIKIMNESMWKHNLSDISIFKGFGICNIALPSHFWGMHYTDYPWSTVSSFSLCGQSPIWKDWMKKIVMPNSKYLMSIKKKSFIVKK
jgi:hypothetical protein